MPAEISTSVRAHTVIAVLDNGHAITVSVSVTEDTVHIRYPRSQHVKVDSQFTEEAA